MTRRPPIHRPFARTPLRHNPQPSKYDRQGKRELHTGSKAWRLLRQRILIRDKWLCQDCGQFGDQVDHIDGNDSNNDHGNLQTLCARCHSSKTAKENGGFGNANHKTQR